MRMRLLSQRSMSDQLKCHGCQEERKCRDRRPRTNNMEPLRLADERPPILWWRTRVPGERGTVDRNGTDDPDQDPDEHGEQSRAPEPKAGRGTIENCYGNP